MSLKRRIEFKYNHFVNAIRCFKLPVWLDTKAVRIVLVGIIVFVGSAYIIKTTTSATSGYEMHELEKQAASLDSDIQKTQIEIADYSSINSIQSRLAKMNMVAVGNIEYFNNKDMAVAKK